MKDLIKVSSATILSENTAMASVSFGEKHMILDFKKETDLSGEVKYHVKDNENGGAYEFIGDIAHKVDAAPGEVYGHIENEVTNRVVKQKDYLEFVKSQGREEPAKIEVDFNLVGGKIYEVPDDNCFLKPGEEADMRLNVWFEITVDTEKGKYFSESLLLVARDDGITIHERMLDNLIQEINKEEGLTDSESQELRDRVGGLMLDKVHNLGLSDQKDVLIYGNKQLDELDRKYDLEREQGLDI